MFITRFESEDIILCLIISAVITVIIFITVSVISSYKGSDYIGLTNENNETQQNITFIDVDESKIGYKRNNKSLILDTDLLNTDDLLDLEVI